MLRNVPYNIIYSSGETEPAEFFLDSLLESDHFDLALGFFSSSAIRSLSIGFAFFIHNGGKMRVLINNLLSPQDKDAIETGIQNQNSLIFLSEEEKDIITNIDSLFKSLSIYDDHFFKCLSFLISIKRIEFKAIVPIKAGIAHHKFGIFSDQSNNKVAFTGSINFSKQALFNNLETISCYKSWTNEKTERERLNYYDSLFCKIWNGNSSVAREIPIEKVQTVLNSHYPTNGIQELLNEEKELISGLNKDELISESLSSKYGLLLDLIQNQKIEAHFPENKTPWKYQEDAFKSWKEADYIGFFEMATGTGKTITSLNCGLELYKEEHRLQTLILVPTITLADQWKNEIESFNFNNIIICNSSNSNWINEIIEHINRSLLSDSSIFIISTYATFSLRKFQSILNRLPSSTLFIADEAHNLGTSKAKENLPTKFKRRIGLSATPKRHFDVEGTLQILEFFNSIYKPTFRFDMQEAIEKGFLCKYYYFPKVVTLTASELDEYIKISKKLLKFFNTSNNDFAENPIVSALLLKRKRIIHKAERKIAVFKECLDQISQTRGKINYTLVYVPEGKSNQVDREDRALINEYSKVLSEEYHLKQHQFIGDTKNRDKILSQFSSSKIEVLTAMKCLDEGIDVKRTETAIFCASTSNPRQFIQRRGRILRKHPDKKFAYIYDMIVIPEILEKHFSDGLNMERSILQNELRRVYEFAFLAENKWQALQSLEEVSSSYEIDIFST